MPPPTDARGLLSRRRFLHATAASVLTLLAARPCGPALTGAASSAGPTRSTAASQPAEEALSPLLASVVAAPRPVLGTDHRQHLAYEILLINASTLASAPFDVTLDTVEALDPDRDVVVGTLQGPALAEVLLRFRSGDPGATLGPGEGGVLLMDTSFDEGALDHASRSAVPRSDDGELCCPADQSRRWVDEISHRSFEQTVSARP
jgi:hypothetical protein